MKTKNIINIKNNDVLDDIQAYPGNEFNLIFSDPPYNLSTEWIINSNGKYEVKGNAKDFMNKWNGLTGKALEVFFKEAFRVLKYGGYCVLYGMDRQLSPFLYYAQLAGFEICQSLYWFFISNFPKATDTSKMIDRKLDANRDVMGINSNNRPNQEGKKNNTYGKITYCSYITAPASKYAKIFHGYKYSIAPLKQTCETIMILRKPIKNNSYIADIMEWVEYHKEHGKEHPEISLSILNIDGERVEIDFEHDENIRLNAKNHNFKTRKGFMPTFNHKDETQDKGYHNSQGRYPSQLFVDSEAAKVLDRQSGIQKSNDRVRNNKQGETMNVYNNYNSCKGKGFSDTGGASRILHTCDYEDGEMDLLFYCPKASQKERNAGLKLYTQSESKKIKNNHPTVKPIKLNAHILNLFKQPDICNQKIYIPFSGSGSEIIGAIKAGYKPDNITACEIEKEYIKIAKARIEYWKKRFKQPIQEKLL